MSNDQTQIIPDILDEIKKLNPRTILEIGVDFGKYGVLLRDKLEHRRVRNKKNKWRIKIDGIEVAGTKNPIHDYVYNRIYYGDFKDIYKTLPQYDVVFMNHSLEYFNKEEGKEFLNNIANISKKGLIISTSIFPTMNENVKSRWSQIDFIDFNFEYKLVNLGLNGEQIFIIHPNAKVQTKYPFDNISIQNERTYEKKLTIAYFLPHKNLTGGLKMLLEQMKHLRKRGHTIYAFHRGNKGDTVLPSWIRFQVDKEISVPKNESFLSYLDHCDVGVAGWIDQMEELSHANIPIVYWEQGNEFLFGDALNENIQTFLKYHYLQPIAITSVSPIISKILLTRFGRIAPVIPNGIDTDFYCPGLRPNENRILIVGNPNLRFKGFDVAVKSLIRVWRLGFKFKVTWISQIKPSLEKVPLPFPIEFIVMPTQEELAHYYRNSDLFLFTSWYEGFGMPPLEAMASGIPVVSTSCRGIDVYAKDKVNVLLAEPGDVEKLTENIILLISNDKIREKLAVNGRETALQFSSSTVTEQLERYLYQLLTYKNIIK